MRYSSGQGHALGAVVAAVELGNRISCGDRSWTFQEPQVERPEHQDDPDVRHQPLPESVPEEQDVHADHDSYQREHVKHDGYLSSHLVFSPGMDPSF